MKFKAGIIIIIMTMGFLTGCNTVRSTPDAATLQPTPQDMNQQKLQQSMQS